jgi:hypothetical protein
MQRFLPICVVAGAITLGALALPAQAAPVAGLSTVPADAARSMTTVDHVGWRRWRWHRNWWWRWRRY